MATSLIREAVGIFPDARSLQGAVDDLLVRGLDRSFLSLMATHRVIERDLAPAAALADDPAVPRMAYVGSDSRVEGRSACVGALAYVGAFASAGVVAATGGGVAIAALAIVAAGTGGGVLGAWLGNRLDGRRVRDLADQIERGGILLWVRTIDPEWEAAACAILARNGAGHVHVHEMFHTDSARDGGVSRTLAWIDKPIDHWLRFRQRPERGADRLPLH